ncbi:sphingomyelin phosphodiesterase 4 [Bacillus rossius redtenbacheri]|uniref:sphingomyelin phosphodiesterase 4 n=1 Tax=Bacillus rossius redtenbacheri TaxID=93214 RepID=UPI002FDD90F1
MTSPSEGIDAWLAEAAGLPLRRRCAEVGRLLDECRERDLEALFPAVVGDVFGAGGSRDWGLRSTLRKYAPADFDALVGLLGPQGPVFRACYRLLANCYLKYQFPLAFLPPKIKKLIEDGSVPPFYMDKVYVDHQTRMVAALQLNPLELYLFHFAHRLVNPWLQRPDEAWRQGDTPYARLLEEYLGHLLPCEGPVQPCPPRAVAPLHVSPARPASPPSLLRASLLLSQASPAGARRPTSPISAHPAAGRTEIWRSETAVQVFMDYWLGCDAGDSPPALRGSLPCLEHVRIVRHLIKYLHYFANSASDEVTALNELKRIILPSCQGRIYSFLRCTIQQWPLDSSFRLILETWLSFVQPWRYPPPPHRAADDDDGPGAVDARWLGFVAQNLLAYTAVFRQLLPRFSRVDLAMPKNAYMLYRVTKVFSQPGLSPMVAEVERALEGQGHKWSAVVRQQALELEGPAFVYEPLFSAKMAAQVCQFVAKVQEAQRTAQRLARAREAEALRRPSGLSAWLRELLLGRPDSDEYSVEDRRKVLTYLDLSRHHLLAMFQLDASQVPDFGDASPLGSPGCDEIFRTPDTSARWSPDGSGQRRASPRISPPRARQTPACLGYEGDPDLQPIRSFEIAFLVRFLYQVCSKINEMYGVEIFNVYHRGDVWGRIARQFLQPPLRIRVYDKSASHCGSPLVEEVLPPRLSLRSLANRWTAARLAGFLLAAWWALGWGPFTSAVLLLAACLAWASARALLAPLFASEPAPRPRAPLPDDSFDERAFLSS